MEPFFLIYEAHLGRKSVCQPTNLRRVSKMESWTQTKSLSFHSTLCVPSYSSCLPPFPFFALFTLQDQSFHLKHGYITHCKVEMIWRCEQSVLAFCQMWRGLPMLLRLLSLSDVCEVKAASPILTPL